MKIDCGWDVKFNHNKCNWSHRHILFCGKIITRKRAQQSNKLSTKSLTTENNTAVHKIALFWIVYLCCHINMHCNRSI